MIPQYPPNSHMMIVEQSSNYGRIASKAKTKADYSNYSTPFFVNTCGGVGKEGQTKVNLYDSIKHNDDNEEGDSFFKSIQGFLIFGKLIGVLPFSGIFGSSWRDLSYRFGLHFTLAVINF